MKILIATIGTRGDVQPYVALAVGLKAAGHNVTICTCPRFREFITGHGIKFVHLEDGLLELLESNFGRAIVENLDGIFGVLRTIPQVLKRVGPIHRRMVDDCWSGVEASNPDLIIYHPKMFCVPAFAAVTQIPAILAMLAPLHVTTGSAPLFGRSFGSFYNRCTYGLGHCLTKFGTRAYLREWRSQYDPNGLSKDSGPNQTSDGKPIPVIHAFSKFVFPRPTDWPEHASITGYWFLPPESIDGASWSPSQELEDFLKAGSAPVYFGFGSMAAADASRVTQIILSAIEKANVRAIIATGWGGIVPDNYSAERVYVLESAPHEWLFSQVAAVVHHGGAGTTAAGLRAGCPTIICPFGLDQPFWGKCVAQLGAGPSPISQKKLAAGLLVDALKSVTTDESFRISAESIAVSIRSEDGIANAIKIIEQVYAHNSGQ